MKIAFKGIEKTHYLKYIKAQTEKKKKQTNENRNKPERYFFRICNSQYFFEI